MKNIFFYLLQVIVCSGILYSYYHFFLRNKKFHQYNRFFLLVAALGSLLIPFIDLPVYFRSTSGEASLLLQTLTVISSDFPEKGIFSSGNDVVTPSNFNFLTIAGGFYLLIGVLVFVRFVTGLSRIRSLLRKYPAEKLDKISFVNTAEPGTPFSFFNWLFWNKKIELLSSDGRQIFRHELFHIRQKHSWDIILLELLTVAFWMNPFFHLMKKEIKVIHEFLADEFAVKDSENMEYAELLLKQVLGTQLVRLTNPFFHHQIKRRIAMITLSKKPSYQYFRKVLALPLLAAVFILFSFKLIKNKNSSLLSVESPITVVIDPGHGGKDFGSSANGVHEKDINLELAKKIQKLNKNKNIQLLFTRLDDSYNSPKEDAEFAVKSNADILISLHVNANSTADPDKKGLEIYFSPNKKASSKNMALVISLMNQLQNTYKLTPNAFRADSGTQILNSVDCAGALIELGYLTNPEDFKFITNEQVQEQIAMDILRAIEQFAGSMNKKIEASINIDESSRMTIYSDTVPKPITGIKSEEIKEINVRGSQIVIKLKSGDSILATQNQFLARQQQETQKREEYEKLLETKQQDLYENMKSMELEQRKNMKEREIEFREMMELKRRESLNNLKMMELDHLKMREQEELEFRKVIESKQKEPGQDAHENIKKMEIEHRKAMVNSDEIFKKMMGLREEQVKIEMQRMEMEQKRILSEHERNMKSHMMEIQRENEIQMKEQIKNIGQRKAEQQKNKKQEIRNEK